MFMQLALEQVVKPYWSDGINCNFDLWNYLCPCCSDTVILLDSW